MSFATLFGKLQEHEMELQRQNQHEENDKKKKSVDFGIRYEYDMINKINLCSIIISVV